MNSTQPTTTATPLRTRTPLAAVVVDEVFADFEFRVDSPAEESSTTSFAAETEQLIATIGHQLKSIEDQKNRLVRLMTDLGLATDF
ncbi:hypothetical protein [Aeoliella sp. SH292]|uniref:hypothetical protein n=1 Tax=Aeoliella sp. SH292 TaxID=3454464 RepID=UPI003F9D0F4E